MSGPEMLIISFGDAPLCWFQGQRLGATATEIQNIKQTRTAKTSSNKEQEVFLSDTTNRPSNRQT